MTGKEKCKYLKELRAKIAAENGVEGFEYKECPYQGECEGTCPACDAEAEALQQALSACRQKTIPQHMPDYPPTDVTMGVVEPNYRLLGEMAVDDKVLVANNDIQKPIDKLPGRIVMKTPVNNTKVDYIKTRGKLTPSAFKREQRRLQDKDGKKPRGLLKWFKKDSYK